MKFDHKNDYDFSTVSCQLCELNIISLIISLPIPASSVFTMIPDEFLKQKLSI